MQMCVKLLVENKKSPLRLSNPLLIVDERLMREPLMTAAGQGALPPTCEMSGDSSQALNEGQISAVTS